MSFTLTVIRPEETLPRFRTVEALLADCPPTPMPQVLTPEAIAAWVYFARQQNIQWNERPAWRASWKKEDQRLRTFVPGSHSYRHFIVTTIWAGEPFIPVLRQWTLHAEEGCPPLTPEEEMENLHRAFDSSGGGGRAVCELVFDADRDEFVGVLVPRC